MVSGNQVVVTLDDGQIFIFFRGDGNLLYTFLDGPQLHVHYVQDGSVYAVVGKPLSCICYDECGNSHKFKSTTPVKEISYLNYKKL